MKKITVQLQKGYTLEVEASDAFMQKVASHYGVLPLQVTEGMIKNFVIKATINAIDTSTFST